MPFLVLRLIFVNAGELGSEDCQGIFFCSTSMFLVSKKQVEKHQFLVKRGVATKCCFMNLCFAKCEKLSFFGHVWQILVDVQKQNRYFSTFWKAKKNKKNDHFSWLLAGTSKGY